jgi:hypothetical protein
MLVYSIMKDPGTSITRNKWCVRGSVTPEKHYTGFLWFTRFSKEWRKHVRCIAYQKEG